MRQQSQATKEPEFTPNIKPLNIKKAPHIVYQGAEPAEFSPDRKKEQSTYLMLSQKRRSASPSATKLNLRTSRTNHSRC